MYFDSHVHLNDDLLYDDLDNVIAAAHAAGVTRMVCVGYDVPSSRRALHIAEIYEGVYAAVGLHPENAHLFNENDFTDLETMISHPKTVAIGECGLDRYWDKTQIAIQTEVFIRQIAWADRYQKPLIVHMREATAETYAILSQHKSPRVRGVMHCYSGSPETAAMFIRLGMFISLAGPVTFKNARVSKEVAFHVDLANLLIETDAPYLAPDPFRGKRNESKYVPYVGAEIARIKGLDSITVANATFANASFLFGIK
ncbi:MAG: TatD family hydrolase [bacterium]